MWGIRFFIFTLFESPRYLISMGRDAEAVDIIHKIAQYNGKTSNLSVEDLEKVGKTELVGKKQFVKRSAHNVQALFHTKKMAFSTSLLISLWGE